jgi:hypothetical protein
MPVNKPPALKGRAKITALPGRLENRPQYILSFRTADPDDADAPLTYGRGDRRYCVCHFFSVLLAFNALYIIKKKNFFEVFAVENRIFSLHQSDFKGKNAG